MPDDSASLFGFAAFEDAFHRLFDGAVLLVAGEFLDQLAVGVLVDDEISEHVQQRGRMEQAGDEAGLAFGWDAEAVHELGFGEWLD